MAAHRAFTVESAHEMIPWVESVFERLDGHRQRWQKHNQGCQVLETMWSDRIEAPENPDHNEYQRHRRAMDNATRTVQGIIDQDLTGRGVRLPAGGLESGIVDFPTTFEGRWVYLCWQRGEPRISHWHELHTGFRGRSELADEHTLVMGKYEELPDDAGLDF